MADPSVQTESAPAPSPAPAPAAPPSRATQMADAVASLMQAKGLATVPSDAPPADPASLEQPPPSSEAAKPEVAAEPPVEAKDPRELYDRLARKDRLYQEERNRARTLEQQATELRAEQERFFQRLAQDPIAVLRERGIRFGDIAMQAAVGKRPAEAEADPSKAALPPAIQAKLEEQEAFVAELRREREQAQQATQHQSQVQVVSDYLKDKGDYPLVNELGKHAEVLARVHAHVGKNGAFADDREAAEVLEFYAREIEAEQRRELLAYTSKPGVKSLLAKELGLMPAQKEATPARQEIEGSRVTRNPAPALTNDLASQRGAVVEPKTLTIDELRRRTAEEMQQLLSRQRAAQ